MDARLEDAYRATTYWVETPERWIALRVGEASEPLDRLLGPHESWALVTADNPRSVPLPPEENRKRRCALRAEVRWPSFPTVAVADPQPGAEPWPPELGLLLLGIGRKEALALGRRHEQNAILFGRKGGPVEMLRC